MKRLILTLALLGAVAAPTAVAGPSILRLAPAKFNFGTRPVGTENIKSALLTNTSASPVLVTFDILSMPDDFGFEAPGLTCPPAGGFVLAPSESCVATAAFRPSEFFAGLHQTAAVAIVASDPSTGAVLDSETLTMSGTGK
jgi:hypothetical protein